MSEVISIIAFIFLTTLMGFNIIIFFEKQNLLGFFGNAGLSYLFGIAAVTIEMFILWLLKIKLSFLVIMLPWCMLAICNFRSYKDYFKAISGKLRIPLRLNKAEVLLIALIIFTIFYTFFRAMLKPVEDYDDVAIWSLKGKILFISQLLPQEFFYTIKTKFHGTHIDYPLLLPFSEVWFYTFMNNFNDYLVKVLFPMNFFAFLLVYYALLKQAIGSRALSLAFTFMLISVGIFNKYATVGYADMQMAIYSSVAFMSFYILTRKRNFSYFIISILSSAFALWTKNEGAVCLVATMILTFIFLFKEIKQNKSFSNHSLGMIIALAVLSLVFMFWLTFKQRLGLQNDIMNAGNFKVFNVRVLTGKLLPILYAYQEIIFGIKYWNFIWVGLIYTLIRGFKNIFSNEYIYISLPLLMTMAAYTLIFIISPHDIKWQLGTSADRLALHILPVAVFYIALSVNKEIGQS